MTQVENISIEEMEAVVQAYIKEQKGVDVNINIQGAVNKAMPHPLQLFMLQGQLNKLNAAYNVAKEYFDSKK